MDNKLTLPCEVENVSDGYHTFKELYEHRCALFVALMLAHRGMAWWSGFHDDGSTYDGWIIVGMDLPSGTVTYHVPIAWVPKLKKIHQMVRAPKWDGHTSADVVKRLLEFIEQS